MLRHEMELLSEKGQQLAVDWLAGACSYHSGCGRG